MEKSNDVGTNDVAIVLLRSHLFSSGRYSKIDPYFKIQLSYYGSFNNYVDINF